LSTLVDQHLSISLSTCNSGISPIHMSIHSSATAAARRALRPASSLPSLIFVRSMSTSLPSSAEASGSRPRTPTRIPGPVETSIQSKVSQLSTGMDQADAVKLVETFSPVLIRVQNDSSKHAHHSAMRAIGGGGGETREPCLSDSPGPAHSRQTLRSTW
jgi:hypothetical protein